MAFGPGLPNNPPGAMEIVDQRQRQNVHAHLNELAGLARLIQNATKRNAVLTRLRNWSHASLGTQAEYDLTYVADADDGGGSAGGDWGDPNGTPGAEEVTNMGLRRRFWQQLQACYAHANQLPPPIRAAAKTALRNVIDQWLGTQAICDANHTLQEAA